VTPITGMMAASPRHREGLGADRIELHRPEADRRDGAAGEGFVADRLAVLDHRGYGARVEIGEQHDVGAIAGCDQPAVAQAEAARRRPRRGAIDVRRGRAARDGAADQVVEMAFLGDVERIAVVGAEAEERRRDLVDEGRSACTSLETLPSRIRTCMPLRSFSIASSGVVVSWQLRTPQAR
jgi:hypothetical protein